MRTIKPKIVTPGDLENPTVIQFTFNEANGARVAGRVRARVRICDGQFAYANGVGGTKTIVPSDGCRIVETHTANKDLTLESSIAAAASRTLTVTGVVIDTETVTVGDRVYEFDTHNASTITAGRVRANISASAVKAQGTLTLPTIPVAGDSMQIGLQTYAFVASGQADAPGEISIGANVAAAQVNIVAAINGTDGFNAANARASAAAFIANVCTLTALAGGTIGNAVVTAQLITPADGVFNAGTLGTTTAGVDCSAANAITALVAAINGDAQRKANAVDGAGDTVIVTALNAGTAGNTIAVLESMANASFPGVIMTGGTNNVHGVIRVAAADEDGSLPTAVRIGPPLLSPEPTDWAPVLIEFQHVA